jgi:hypothetical protein
MIKIVCDFKIIFIDGRLVIWMEEYCLIRIININHYFYDFNS